jgi:UDP-glucose 4-epimerase
MHVLVTGGAGFIGSHIVERLLERNHRVTVVDDLSGGGPHHLSDRADFHQMSILDRSQMQLFKDVDVVVHAAAQTSVSASVNDPVDDALTNIGGTVQTLRSAAISGVRRFIYLSSAAVYATEGSPPFSEGHPIEPTSPYGLSKWTGEAYVRLLGSLMGVEWAILRLANVYGPRQSLAGEAGVIARWVDAIVDGRPVTLHGDGGQTRDFIYVEDVAKAVVRALQVPIGSGCTLNVSTGRGSELCDVLSVLEEISGRQAVMIHEPSRVGDIRHSALNNGLARECLGWQPYTALREGLARTVADMAGREGGANQ